MPSATRAATTVVGTVARCQPAVGNPGRETASPPSVTFADDWIAHPSRSSSRIPAASPRPPPSIPMSIAPKITKRPMVASL